MKSKHPSIDAVHLHRIIYDPRFSMISYIQPEMTSLEANYGGKGKIYYIFI